MNEKIIYLRNRLVVIGLAFTGIYFIVEIIARYYIDFHYALGPAYGYLFPILLVLGIVWLASFCCKYAYTRLEKEYQAVSESEMLLRVVAMAVIPRLVLLLLIHVEPYSDYEIYFNMAQQYAQTGVYPTSAYAIAIIPNSTLYVAFLAAVFRLFGVSVQAGLIANLLLFTGAAILFYLSLRKLTTQRISLIGAAIFCLNPAFLFFCLQLATEQLGLLFLMAGLYAFLVWEGEDKCSRKGILAAVFCGICIGISNNVRPNALILLIAFLIAILLYPQKKNLILMAVSIVSFILASKGLQAIQSVLLQSSLSTINYGWTLFDGLDLETYGIWRQDKADVLAQVIAQNPPERVQEVMLDLALEKAKTFTLADWIRLAIGKGTRIWSCCDYMIAPASPILTNPYLVAFIDFMHQMELAVYSILTITYARMAWRRSTCMLLPALYLMPLGMIAVHTFICTIPRYQYLAIPLLYATGAWLLQQILVLRKETRL